MAEQPTSPENPTPDREDDIADAAMALSVRISSLLTGKGSAVQSAVLADLTSRWLSGHLSKSRKELFDSWTELVWKLVPANVQLTSHAPTGPTCSELTDQELNDALAQCDESDGTDKRFAKHFRAELDRRAAAASKAH